MYNFQVICITYIYLTYTCFESLKSLCNMKLTNELKHFLNEEKRKIIIFECLIIPNLLMNRVSKFYKIFCGHRIHKITVVIFLGYNYMWNRIFILFKKREWGRNVKALLSGLNDRSSCTEISLVLETGISAQIVQLSGPSASSLSCPQ